jgi:predicted nucleic acid-binding Zn ribbon protein
MAVSRSGRYLLLTAELTATVRQLRRREADQLLPHVQRGVPKSTSDQSRG